jgi:hypothetical protein
MRRRKLASDGPSPLLLVGVSTLPTVVSDEITRLGTTSVLVLGGTAAIDATAFGAIEGLVGL